MERNILFHDQWVQITLFLALRFFKITDKKFKLYSLRTLPQNTFYKLQINSAWVSYRIRVKLSAKFESLTQTADWFSSKVDRKIPKEMPGLDASKVLQNRFKIAFNSLLFLQFPKMIRLRHHIHQVDDLWTLNFDCFID